MKAIVFLVIIIAVSGCGVKGDPIPPGTPVELGRGQPMYKRATEEFAFPDLPPVYDDQEKKSETTR